MMGAIRNVINGFDASSEVGKTQRELVENLAKLAESKAQFFELEVSTGLRTAGSPDNQTVPVEAVLNSVTQTHAYASDSAGKIGDTVKAALKSFVTGSKTEILDGVGNLISDALTIFLGSGSASESTLKQYYVMTEGFSVVRVDLRAWYLDVEATSIKTKVQKATAFVAVKSTVDLAKIRFNTFLNLYQNQLASMKLTDNQITTALSEAQKIYQQFVGTGGLRAMAAPEVASLAALPASTF
jgi:hypothetical protein